MSKFVLIIILSLLTFSFAGASDFLNKESLSNSDKIEILWHDYLNKQLDPISFYSSIKSLVTKDLSITNQLRVFKMKSSFENLKSSTPLNIDQVISEEEALKLASEWIFIGHLVGNLSVANLDKIQKAKKYLKKLEKFTPKSVNEVKDLFYRSPDYAYYNNGEYKNTLKVYLFCRHDRHYPCLFVMRDIFDNVVRNNDGSLWTLPGLAHSRRELPYNITNGYTPSGVHTLDSVMPHADRNQAFGQWRRVKLNWIPKSADEANTKQFLPKSSLSKTWWHEANIARDVGRKWLRIHGTGNRNTDRDSSFYPHYPTSGCISTREMKYDGVTYKDQRIILNKMMQSMQLAPIFDNEVQIKGVLYVVELDDKKEKVTKETLREFGIE